MRVDVVVVGPGRGRFSKRFPTPRQALEDMFVVTKRFINEAGQMKRFTPKPALSFVGRKRRFKHRNGLWSEGWIVVDRTFNLKHAVLERTVREKGVNDPRLC